MFTGIVSTTGTIQEITRTGGDSRLRISCSSIEKRHFCIGDSIAVSGVCLTMLEPEETGFSADVSNETLELTTLGNLKPGQQLNLELAMGLEDRLGGHMVSGHVDGKAQLLSRRKDARAERFEFELPADLARYVAKKGSICLIPHTLEVTTLGDLQAGDEVNIEVDLIARYLERLTDPDLQATQEQMPL